VPARSSIGADRTGRKPTRIVRSRYVPAAGAAMRYWPCTSLRVLAADRDALSTRSTTTPLTGRSVPSTTTPRTTCPRATKGIAPIRAATVRQRQRTIVIPVESRIPNMIVVRERGRKNATACRLDSGRSRVHSVAFPWPPPAFVPEMMMRFLLCVLVAVAACSSSGTGASSSPTPASQTVRVSGASGVADLRVGGGADMTGVHTLPYSLEQVWRALPFVFDSLGIPVAMMEPTRRVIGNEGFKVRQRLKGTPLSRFIDCGNSTQIGVNADNYDVVLILTAQVRAADPSSSSITTTFNAVAKPANFAQDYSQCNSKGVMESRFIDILQAKLQK